MTSIQQTGISQQTFRRRMTSRRGTSNLRGSVARAMKLLISHVRLACGTVAMCIQTTFSTLRQRVIIDSTAACRSASVVMGGRSEQRTAMRPR